MNQPDIIIRLNAPPQLLEVVEALKEVLVEPDFLVLPAVVGDHPPNGKAVALIVNAQTLRGFYFGPLGYGTRLLTKETLLSYRAAVGLRSHFPPGAPHGES